MPASRLAYLWAKQMQETICLNDMPVVVATVLKKVGGYSWIAYQIKMGTSLGRYHT